MIQKAMIEVDEKGTVASAATSTMLSATAYMPPVEVTVDRPFLFLIVDTNSKLVLLMGHVQNPLSQ